jgi:Methyltransferase domain
MIFLRDQIYYFFNFLARHIPRSVLRRILRALYHQPDLARRVGYTVFPLVFYSPFANSAEVDESVLKLKRPLPGVDINLSAITAGLQELTAFAPEVDQFLKGRQGQLKHWNSTYAAVDSAILYAMLRHLKPRRYIEVGCGYSTRVSSAALRRNRADGRPCEALFIEPYPPKHLSIPELPGEFLQKKVQQVPLERFQQLESGDVLFIDTSHIIKVQNDVEFELLRILPTLKPGVCVHIHDIFTPYDYPAEWLIGNGTNLGANNEQYALECLLSGGRQWEVTVPLFLLWKDHRPLLNQLINSDERPCAFWIRKSSGAG